MIVNFAAAMRRRSAFALCREYGMSAAEIAPVLGLNEQQFLRALKRDGLSYSDMQQGNRQLRLAQRIMDLLRKELDTLSSLDEETSGKVRLDALALLHQWHRPNRIYRHDCAVCDRLERDCCAFWSRQRYNAHNT